MNELSSHPTDELRERYLYLMKMCLSHALWEETTRPIDPRRAPKSFMRFAAGCLLAILKPFKLRLVLDVPVDNKARVVFGRSLPIR